MTTKKSPARTKNESVEKPQRLSGELPVDYAELLDDLKTRIRSAQVKAALSVNQELVLLYWNIGRKISEKHGLEGWGAKVIEHLAADLRRTFPEMKGFSPRNLTYMRDFANAYPEEPFLQQAVAKIPWGHNVRILDRVKDPVEREWYIRATMEFGWSRDVLVHQIESGLFYRQGKALTNFSRTLPALQSDLAQQVLKDPYTFDFLDIGQEAEERELEKALTEHIREFLLELGVGFAFVGSQYHLIVGGEDFFIDMLFYHLRLRCFVVIDLKVKEFKPEYAGKMNFYLSAVDDLLRHPEDRPSVGIILCKGRNEVVAEYALRDTNKPLGITTYELAESLPEPLKSELPSIEDLEKELSEYSPKDS